MSKRTLEEELQNTLTEKKDEPVAKPKQPAPKRQKKAATPKKVPKPTLKNVLASLTHPQLNKMVTQFFEEKHPELKDEFIDCTPPPNIEDMRSELAKLFNAINRAFPNARFGSNRDNYAYKRVSGSIRRFKTELMRCSKKFIDGKHFNYYLTDFIPFALDFIQDLPQFDEPKNNSAAELLYKKVVTNGKSAVKHSTLKKEQYDQVLQSMEKNKKHLDELIKVIVDKQSKC
eukprot:gene10142-12440_t